MKYHETLFKIITIAKAQLTEIDEATFEKKPANKWSKKEIIGHLIDSGFNNYSRFIKSTEQEKLIYAGYKQTELVIKNQYQNRKADEIINTWFALNQHTSFLIENISNEILKRKTIPSYISESDIKLLLEEGKDTLSYLIWDYIEHLEHHLSQIIDDYKRINPPFEKPH